MAITRANLPPLLRAATALHPPHSPHHYHHNSLTSFLRSHPPNNLISNPHSFSTFLYRRVPPRATVCPNPLTLSISHQHLVSRSVHTHATALHKRRRTFHILDYALAFGCIAATGGTILMYKYLVKPRMSATVNDKMELSFHGIIPHKYRKGHWVIIDGLAQPINDNKISNAAAKKVGPEGPWEFYISATEVLVWPQNVFTAVRKNNNILAVKQMSSEDSYIIPATTYQRTTSSGEILIPDNLSKPESKSIVFKLHSEHESTITKFVSFTLDKFQDLPKLLEEGHTIFIKGFINLPLGSTNCDLLIDKSNKVSSDDNWHKTVTGNSIKEKVEYIFLAEAIKKDDERYISREAPTAIRRNPAE